jgi:restriction system protein
MEELVAAVLRALGYKARVTPKGPDRGRDVIASPDGLGFQTPRVIAEVKHRPKDPIGATTIRSFLGGLREGDRGLFVSTGGFTREAHYEAERASVPVTLLDLDQLAVLIVEHYESFDLEGRSLVPLVRGGLVKRCVNADQATALRFDDTNCPSTHAGPPRSPRAAGARWP